MKILVVDDHALMRDAMSHVITSLLETATVLEAADAAGALETIDRHPDIELVLLDLMLPDRSGLALLDDIAAQHLSMAVVVLSSSAVSEDINRALEAGALGYLPKSSTRAVITAALRLVLDGGVYIPPEALASRECRERERDLPATPAEPGPGRPRLTERQADVLRAMMLGQSNKRICRALDISEATVKNHVTAVLRALGARNRTEAVIIATATLQLDLPKSGSPQAVPPR